MTLWFVVVVIVVMVVIVVVVVRIFALVGRKLQTRGNDVEAKRREQKVGFDSKVEVLRNAK